jgi:hypothetical protein
LRGLLGSYAVAGLVGPDGGWSRISGSGSEDGEHEKKTNLELKENR